MLGSWDQKELSAGERTKQKSRMGGAGCLGIRSDAKNTTNRETKRKSQNSSIQEMLCPGAESVEEGTKITIPYPCDFHHHFRQGKYFPRRRKANTSVISFRIPCLYLARYVKLTHHDGLHARYALIIHTLFNKKHQRGQEATL